MGSPKDIRSIVGDALIEGVTLLSSRKWRVTSDHDEQDDGRGEEVDFTANVWLPKMDLWSHVVLSSQLGVKITLSISSFNWSGETKIGYLQIIVFIQEQVLRFKVSVGNTLLVMAVVKSHQQLSEEIAGLIFLQLT